MAATVTTTRITQMLTVTAVAESGLSALSLVTTETTRGDGDAVGRSDGDIVGDGVGVHVEQLHTVAPATYTSLGHPQSSNAFSPIAVIVSGSAIVANLEQPSNELFPMWVTVSGIVMVVKLEQ
jgi:hypothetical protein